MHYNTCSIGNSKQVVIVFEHWHQNLYDLGTNDDLCWKDGQSQDDQFSVNESNVDDVGENDNFHDKVSSLSIKNSSSTNDLCVWLYVDAFQGGNRWETWVPAGDGDRHIDQVPHNDAYDSMDLKRLDEDSCLP